MRSARRRRASFLRPPCRRSCRRHRKHQASKALGGGADRPSAAGRQDAPRVAHSGNSDDVVAIAHHSRAGRRSCSLPGGVVAPPREVCDLRPAHQLSDGPAGNRTASDHPDAVPRRPADRCAPMPWIKFGTLWDCTVKPTSFHYRARRGCGLPPDRVGVFRNRLWLGVGT